MKNHSVLLGLFIGACSVASLSLGADPSVAETITQRLSAATKGDSAGVAVLASRDGKVLYEASFGLADREANTPITLATKFRIGSVTKQFTAAAVVRLAEQEKLSLDDPLAKYFPDFPRADRIRVRQLLTHTSGLRSYTDKPDFLLRVTQPIEPDKLMEWFRDDPADFEPGAGFHYNNSAYFLLGEIISKVTGKSYGAFLRETFFEPLEMHDTGVFQNSNPPSGMAKGYSFVDERFSPALDWDMSWAGGAGAMYSTVRDLHRWNNALYNGKVLNQRMFRAATTPVELPPDVDGMKYGFGLAIFEVKRLPAIGHGGGLNGWASYLLRLPQQNFTVVVLANTQPLPPELSPQAIAHSLVETFLDEEIQALPPRQEDRSVDPQTFVDYVGRYDYEGAIMTVSVEGESLFAQLTDQPKFQIFPQAKDEFFWKIADAEVAFLRDEKGSVHAARHKQNGRSFTASKFDEDAVKLTAEQLDAFVGQYQYGLFTRMTVTRDETQLFAQLTGQPKFPIFPTSETEFEWRIVKANVKFVKGDDGQVTKAVHHQNGTTFDAPRIND